MCVYVRTTPFSQSPGATRPSGVQTVLRDNEGIFNAFKHEVHMVT
jgi:hypothetical protein